MASNLFHTYGRICAQYPWEVIFTTVTMTTCLLSIEPHQSESSLPPHPTSPTNSCKDCAHEAEYNAAAIIIMTIIRCIAILYSYYQLRNLRKLNSKYILIISGLFTVFSSFMFTTAIMNFFVMDISDLKDALFFFLLLIDLSKTSLLAQFALSSNNSQDIQNNIAKGMAILGPTITLDMIVETLLLSVGTLSGVRRLEILSYFACMSVIVNYIVFMTFYPACLYLILELSQFREKGKLMIMSMLKDEYKSNPVVERVKIIMSFGLMLVHVHSRWSSSDKMEDLTSKLNFDLNNTKVATEISSMNEYFLKWLTLSVDHIVILILVLALTVKFIFFEEIPDMKPNTEETIYNKEIQTLPVEYTKNEEDTNKPERNLDECIDIFKNEGPHKLSDKEICSLVNNKIIPAHQLEKVLENPLRGVEIRRKIYSNLNFTDIPIDHFDYKKVMGQCCENVIGYVPIPLGIVGPLNVDGKHLYVPMATTEGCLVASTNRGCRALLSNGVISRIVSDGMTRGPVVRFPNLKEAAECLSWLENDSNFRKMEQEFNSTSNFARLTKIQPKIAGRFLFLRFVAKTADAMGMNMLSKGTEKSLYYLQKIFPNMEILSLSGNFCADKKPAAVNWIEGRGKSVVCEAIVPANIVETVLKTNVQSLVDVNISKNLIGSAIAGSVGGFNAHAANIVTAIFIATGQDPAQNVSSSNCMTLMEPCGADGRDLYVTVSMPSLEVGTVGGGTGLNAQGACLGLLGCRGPSISNPGTHARHLAKAVCATVLAGELSLMAALAAGHLVNSHMAMNRKT